MFNCEKCGNTTQSREAANKKVVAIRPVVYYTTTKIRTGFDHSGDETFTTLEEVVGSGSEIVKEINVCKECNK